MAAPSSESEPPIIALVGPTAVGKTAVGIGLAERLGAEIISADAVAVYRRLDIGAAKPDAAERARAVFHLIDVADPEDDFTVADFARRTEMAISDLSARGRTPLLVGGTGLYIRAVTATLSIPEVPPQPALRAVFESEAERDGTPALHARLAESDPVSAARIQPNDRKRIIRALEVRAVTGKPASAFHTPEGIQGILRPNTRLFGLTMERETLYARVEARVDAMLAAGLLDEVRRLVIDDGLRPDRHKSMLSLGYRQLAAHLLENKPLEEAVNEIKRDTRRFARRQLSWFRADPRIEWIDTTGRSTDETVAVLGDAIQIRRNIR